MLTKSGSPVGLTPKAFDTLLLLVAENGRLVSKERLMDAIWPDAFVEEKTLTQNIFTLRKVLTRDEDGRQYIETVPKHGYRFTAPVEIVAPEFGNHSPTLAVASGSGSISDHQAEINQSAVSPESFDQTTLSAGKEITLFHRLVGAAAIAVIVGAGLLGYLLYSRSLRNSRLSNKSFRNFTLSRITDGASISALTLSHDGRYVAYSVINGDTESLQLKQIQTNSTSEIVSPAPVAYRGITFSPDAAWIYYVTVPRQSFVGTLFRVPFLGGVPQKVFDESVGSRIEFSPEGKRISFVHWIDQNHTGLFVANLDGTGQRQLATLDYEDGFSLDGPAWSPDGKTILAATQSYNGARKFARVLAVDPDTGQVTTLLSNRWNWIGQLTWLADGSGVVLTAWNKDAATLSDQIWLVAYPSGEARRITNDINGYLGVSVSDDARTIAASELTSAKSFWVAPKNDWAQARKITNGTGDLFSERFNLAWTPGGRILYTSRQSGNLDLWMMDSDGTNPKQLTNDPATDFQAVASPDGKYVVFVSNRNGKDELWRIDTDGGHPTRLASTDGVQFPSFSPDSRWVVYEGNAQEKTVLWRVSVDGGTVTQLTQAVAHRPVVSPDGKLIACLMPNDAPGPARLALLNFSDGQVVKELGTPGQRGMIALKWSPNDTLTYVVARDGVANIWSQSLDGSEPVRLTDWKSDSIYGFDWASDGRLVCERGSVMAEIVLIRERSE